MKNEVSEEQKKVLLSTLQERFTKNMHRHEGLLWEQVQAKLDAHPEKLWSLNEMEQTGGEIDVVAFTISTDEYSFYDCSTESPLGRRNTCYDREGLEARKSFKPETSAMDLAQAMGIELLGEEEYKALQQLGEFDKKTSSWLKTPSEIRNLGGALFGDRRYGRVFIYHNSAPSYYGVRGFRGSLKV